MTNWIKKELKHAKSEKKRCKKLYSDWVDNEYNCGPLKFIFAVVSESNNALNTKNNKPSFHTLNDLQISYNRDTQKYLLDVEIGYNNSTESDIAYLERLLSEVKTFVQSQYELKLSYLLETNLFKFLDDMSNYWVADDLITLYCKFYIFVCGYKQNLRNKKSLSTSEENNYDN